jgi:hypothetical protein
MTERDHDTDHEWLLARERGEDVSQVPAAERAAYRQLEQLIAALPDPAPPADWQRRVRAALQAGGARHVPARPIAVPDRARPAAAAAHGARYRWAGITAVATLAAAAAMLRPHPQPRVTVADTPHTEEPRIATEIRAGSVRRGFGQAHIGDALIVTVDVDTAIELRLYGDADQPLARCNDTEGCAVTYRGSHRHYVLEHLLRSTGALRVVMFTGSAFPATFELLDADVATAHAYGGDARQVATIHVD